MIVRHLGIQSYELTWNEMKRFTAERQSDTEDELWLLEHPPVYTQGQAGKTEHVLNPNHIPIIQSDRGGQVTYHAPGQLVVYVLMDIRRRHLAIRTLVCQLEKVLIALLNQFNIDARTQCGAPGVYVNNKKIASIGLRVKNGYTYHGIALNVDMDLAPFLDINPCGFAKLEMTQIRNFVHNIDMTQVKTAFIHHFFQIFENSSCQINVERSTS